MFTIIQDAGWSIWPLLLTSVLTLALIIERLLTLRRTRVLPPNLLEDVLTLVRRQQVSEDVITKLDGSSPLGVVLAAGLRNLSAPRDVMKESIEETGRAVAHNISRYINTLGTIASIAPLMGLFGTVLGMIEIFGSQSPTGLDPRMLAHGISVALYNTGLGIFIAIPAMIFYRHFRARVDSFVIDMEQSAVRLVDIVHGDRA